LHFTPSVKFPYIGLQQDLLHECFKNASVSKGTISLFMPLKTLVSRGYTLDAKQ